MPPEQDEAWKDWRWGAKVIFLASLLCAVFYIAEHDPKMAAIENFVQDIEAQESWGAGGNVLRRLAFLSVAGCGVLALVFGRGRFYWNVPIVLWLMFLAWTGATVLWSIDPGASSRRYILMICCVVGCLGLGRVLTIEQALLAAILAILGWLFIGVSAEMALGKFTPYRGGYRFSGTLHPNSQAANLGILGIAAFTMAKVRPKLKWVFYGVLGLAVLFQLLTKCRTASAVLPVALTAIWFVTQPLKQITLVVLGGVWMVSACVLVFVAIGFDPIAEYSELLLLGRGEETGSSLTGRLPLWNQLSSYIAVRPLEGYGYGAFWTPRNIYDVAAGQEWVISEAHSSYVDTTLQTGLIGALLMVSVAATTFFHAVIIYRKTKKPEYVFLIGAIVFCMIRGFTESGLSGPSGFSAAMYMSMAAHSWRSSASLEVSSTDDQGAEPDHPALESGVVYE